MLIWADRVDGCCIAGRLAVLYEIIILCRLIPAGNCCFICPAWILGEFRQVKEFDNGVQSLQTKNFKDFCLSWWWQAGHCLHPKRSSCWNAIIWVPLSWAVLWAVLVPFTMESRWTQGAFFISTFLHCRNCMLLLGQAQQGWQLARHVSISAGLSYWHPGEWNEGTEL